MMDEVRPAISDNDKERCMEIVREIEKGVRRVNKQYKTVLEMMKEVDLKKGHPLLTLLTWELSSYISNVTSVIVAKVSGVSLHQHPAVWQLVVSRTVIGKLWEMEKRLKYELERRTNQEASANTASNPLSLKPNISNFDVHLEEDDDDDDGRKGGRDDNDAGERGGGDNDDKNQIYKPSKQFPKYYNEEEGGSKKEKGRRGSMKRSILNDLRSEFTDQPSEVYDGSGVNRMLSRKKEEAKTQYEETHFVRLQTSKKEKLAAKRMASMAYADVLNYGYSGPEHDDEKKKKKRKSFRGNKKSKKIKFH